MKQIGPTYCIQQIVEDCLTIIGLLQYQAHVGKEAATICSGVPAPLSGIKAYLEKCVGSYLLQLQKIASVPDGSTRMKKQARLARELLFDTEAAKICAALRSLVKLQLIQTKTKPVDASRVLKLAELLNIWAALEEPVTVEWQPKDKGGFRLVCKPGPFRKAQQIILRDVLLMMGIDNEFDFTRKGAGGEVGFRDEVIKSLCDQYDQWWTSDIADCFGSLKAGHLGWLHIHSRLMRNVVCLPKCALIKVVMPMAQVDHMVILKHINATYPDLPMDDTSQSISEMVTAHTKHVVRRGLPQGSCLSGLLARAFIGRELREAFEGKDVRCVSWIDDLVIATHTYDQVNDVQALVTTRLQSHPAGPILLHDDALHDIKTGPLVALGNVYQPGKGYKGSPVHVKPGLRRFHKFRNRLRKRIWDAGPGHCPFEIATDYARQWFGSNKAWTKVPIYSKEACVKFAIAYLQDWIDQVPFGGMTPKHWNASKPFGGFPDFIKNVPPLPHWLKKGGDGGSK